MKLASDEWRLIYMFVVIKENRGERTFFIVISEPFNELFRRSGHDLESNHVTKNQHNIS